MTVYINCDLCAEPVAEFHGKDLCVQSHGLTCCTNCSTDGKWYISDLKLNHDKVGQFIYGEDDDGADWWKG